jgi:hypothetical protein
LKDPATLASDFIADRIFTNEPEGQGKKLKNISKKAKAYKNNETKNSWRLPEQFSELLCSNESPFSSFVSNVVDHLRHGLPLILKDPAVPLLPHRRAYEDDQGLQPGLVWLWRGRNHGQPCL